MNLFYSKNTTINQNEIVILDQENRHLTKVLRKKIGDKIYVTNGEGVLFNCVIEDSNKNKSVLRIQDYSIFNNDFPKLKIGISLTKKPIDLSGFWKKRQKLEFLKSHQLFPITQRRKFNYDRATKLLLSAMKQSLQYNSLY